MAGLFLSGVTAFPLQTELGWLLPILETPPVRRIAETTHLLPWIARVHHALSDTNAQYPFLAYGLGGHPNPAIEGQLKTGHRGRA